jgi:hypothetical protein
MLCCFTACASNYYNVPREVYEKKVRVLGVAPLMLDVDSDIRHPDKGEIVKIVKDANRKNEKELVEILKGNGEYFTVRFLADDADQLFTTLVSRRERRDDAGVVYNKYFYKPDEIKKFVEKSGVDAVMLVTISGITAYEKIYSSNFMAFLEDNFNSLIMTAQILDADGTLLWEYPNFRQRFITFSPLFALQYPDFEEARANLTDQVKIKNKSIAGITRAFTRGESSSVKGSRQVSVLYNKQFGEMTAFLQYFRNPFVDKKPEKKAEPAVGAVPPKTEEVTRTPLPPPPVTLQPPNTPLEPKAIQGKPAPREFEPAKPIEPGTQVIKEPEIK